MSARPPGQAERDELMGYLDTACADEPELAATVHALAEAGEVDLLRLVRDFRDNLPSQEILARHGPEETLSERLRLIHHVYVDCARRVREETKRPERARQCYLARMLARRDNYQALLDDPSTVLTAQEQSRYQELLRCARDKVPYEDLPGRLGRSAADVQEEVLQLRQLFKEWTQGRKVQAEVPARGGRCNG
jgi:hypothetical protein